MAATGGAHAAEGEGLTIPDALKSGESELVLNGAGKRSKLMAKLYVAALYLKAPSSDSDQILDTDEPMSITMNITSGLVSPKRMEKAIRTGFDNATGGDTTSLDARIDDLVTVFKRGIKEGDLFEFSYLPAKGTLIMINGVEAASIEGLDFKKAFLGIFLGKKPAQKSLKAALLGGT